MELPELAEQIARTFNISDLNSLCFQLNIDYEDLSGQNKKDKIIALVNYCKYRRRLEELVHQCQNLRPEETWHFDESWYEVKPIPPLQPNNSNSQSNFRFWIVGTIGFILLIFWLVNFLPSLSTPDNATPTEIAKATLTPTKAVTIIPTNEPTDTPTMTQPPAPANDPTETPILSTINATIEQKSITPSTFVYTPTTEIENGYTYVLVPAKRASDQTIEIEEYWIGAYEITNLWFAIYLSNTDSNNRCSNGSLCIDTQIPNVRINREDGQWDIDEGYENHPVTGVTWYGADDYCKAIGGRLPEYAEWIHAASWNPITNESMPYPWGDQPPSPDLANYNNHANDTQSVSSLPEGRTILDAYNMLGNVWEFVANTQGINRTAVGGGWDTPQNQLIIGVSYPATERTTSSSLGFRCAR